MKNTTKTYQIGINTFEVEKFTSTGYRVRIILENESVFVGVLSKKQIDKSGRVRNSLGFDDVGRTHEYKWVGGMMHKRVDHYADHYTIKQALAAVRQTWIESVMETVA